MKATMGLMMVFLCGTTTFAQYGGIMQGIGPQPQWMHNPVTPNWSGNWSNGNSSIQQRNVQRRMTQQEVRAKRYAQNMQKRREAEFAAQQRLQKEQFERIQREHLEKMADPVYAASHREKTRKQQEMQAMNRQAATIILGAFLLGDPTFGDVPGSIGSQQERDDLRQYNMNRHRAIQETSRVTSPWNQ